MIDVKFCVIKGWNPKPLISFLEISAEWCFYKPTRNIHFSNKTRVSELQHVLYNLFVGIIQTWGMFYSDLKVLETGGDSGRMVTWYSLIWKVVLKRNWKSRNVVEKRRTGGKTQSLKIRTRGKASFILNVYTSKTISVNPFDVIFITGKKWITAKTSICTSKHAWVERKD